MKIGKTYKANVAIENPWRPPLRYPRGYSLCRITDGTTLSLFPEYTIQIDCDAEQNFAQKIASLPESDCYYDNIYEVYFAVDKHIHKIVEWAVDCFDEVHFKDLNNTIDILKKYEKNKTNPTKT